MLPEGYLGDTSHAALGYKIMTSVQKDIHDEWMGHSFVTFDRPPADLPRDLFIRLHTYCVLGHGMITLATVQYDVDFSIGHLHFSERVAFDPDVRVNTEASVRRQHERAVADVGKLVEFVLEFYKRKHARYVRYVRPVADSK